MNKQPGWWCVLAISLAAGLATGCTRHNVMTRPARPEPAPEATSVPPTPEPVTAPDAAPESAPDTAPPVTDPLLPPAAEAPTPVPETSRTDGRPDWWSDQPQYEVERIWICAEALGPGMAEAKEAALQRARRRMREVLRLEGDAPIPGEFVERTSVRPLPSEGGHHSHAGYVLLSAELP